jgi:hypothetical protein
MPKTKTINNESGKFDNVNKAHRRIIFAAVILTLAVHGLLLVLFDYEPPAPAYKSTGSPGISFMNLGNLKAVKKQQLQNWLEYHEPSMISAPHSKYGYNRLVLHTGFRTAQADRVLKITRAQMPPPQINKFRELELHNNSGSDLFTNYILYPSQLKLAPFSGSGKKLKVTAERQYPQIQANGKPLELSLSPELLKKAAMLKVKIMEIDYRPGPDKLFPRVAVSRSSGNHDFDMAVLHELSLPLASIVGKSNSLNIKIKWRAAEDEEEVK